MPDPAGEREPYELEPGADPLRPAPRPPPPAPGASGAKITADPLLSSFPPDADFTTDPELERAVAGPPKAGEPVRVAVELPEIVKPGLGGAKVWAIVGAVLTAAAVIAIVVNAAPVGTPPAAPTVGARILRAILAVYSVALHTGTGVVAVYAAALLSHRRVTRVELVAARMLAAVSAIALVTSLRFEFWGQPAFLLTAERLLLGAGVYLGLVAILFRLTRTLLMYVVGSHFVLWLVVQLGMELSRALGAGTN